MSAIAEIIESNTTSFVAQCLDVPRSAEPRLFDPPPFGSFVKIELAAAPVDAAPAPPAASTLFDEADPFATPEPPTPRAQTVAGAAVYALVCSAKTTSLDPFRRPTALGMGSEDEIRMQQPQIFELLRTEFTGLLVAYADPVSHRLRRHLPPVPPRIHALVSVCSEDDVRMLTEDLSFLRAILSGSSLAAAGVPAEELAGACLRAGRDVRPGDDAFLVSAARQIASLIPDEYDRLQAILRTVL